MEPPSDVIRRAVERSFAPLDRQAALDALATGQVGRSEYLQMAILALAFGDRSRLCELVWTAQADFRDVLMLLERPKDYRPELTRREVAHRYQAMDLPIPRVLGRYAELPAKDKRKRLSIPKGKASAGRKRRA